MVSGANTLDYPEIKLRKIIVYNSHYSHLHGTEFSYVT